MGEVLSKFYLKILEISEVNSEKFRRYFDEVYLREIGKEILNDSSKMVEALSGKIEVIRNRRSRWYEEILKSFSEIISMKLEKPTKKS